MVKNIPKLLELLSDQKCEIDKELPVMDSLTTYMDDSVLILVNFMYNISFSIVVFAKNGRMNPECSVALRRG